MHLLSVQIDQNFAENVCTLRNLTSDTEQSFSSEFQIHHLGVVLRNMAVYCSQNKQDFTLYLLLLGVLLLFCGKKYFKNFVSLDL